jgi:hypothetical protein
MMIRGKIIPLGRQAVMAKFANVVTNDDTKVRAYEMYRDPAAFEAHLNGSSLAQLKKDIAGIVVKLHGVRCSVVD